MSLPILKLNFVSFSNERIADRLLAATDNRLRTNYSKLGDRDRVILAEAVRRIARLVVWGG